MTIKTKITRDSRLNPTAVTDEFKEIVTATCDLLGVREPDLIRNAVEKYVREMYAHGDVITFDTDNLHKGNVGSQYITGTIYTSFDRPNQFTLEVISDEEKVIGMSVTFLKSNEELERLQQRIIKRFSTINGLGW
nr:MAG TPA: transcriptional repressor [Caudoviricetes sp.]